MKELYYPVALKLKGITVVVAGGGIVAERKVKTLLGFGARVRVVSPRVTPSLRGYFLARKITWVNRFIKPTDVKGAGLIIAATSDAAVNIKMSRWAKAQGILINVVDRAGLSSFISPAVFSKHRATVAVYTHGRDPALSRDLKNFLKENWDVFLSYRNRL
ncbi:MAG: bifunctional precorrin-2 dehydrogenase/sirohydrochlorin ferrochelatase [Candidatus Omnitrophota bacterium]|nr:bifunctional precorrin-2 dehydrogenase/sirohydrochlorin ferrochelatase [Candidatus Omnitrophota bacterium]